MTFRLPDCILTWIFTPRRLFGLVDLSYVFFGSCLPLATGWTLRMFNARFSLRGNRITKKQIWCCCALHYGIRLSLWRTACLYRKPALLRLPKSSQRTSKSAWFSLPYSLRCTRKWHEKLSPPLLILDDPHIPYLLTHLTKVFSAYFAVLVFDLTPFKCDYLSAPINFKPGFFFGRLSETKRLEPIFVTFVIEQPLYASLVLAFRLSILYSFSTITYGQPFCQLKRWKR